MKSPIILCIQFILIIAPLRSFAQNTVEVSSHHFSDGVHPTFHFLFEGTDAKYVESWWRDELKKISASVSSKKELIGAAALVPAISSDTLRILVKTEQRKGSPHTIAHVAIRSTNGFIGPDSEPRAYDGALGFVQQHSTSLRRQLAQQELTDAEKGLSTLKKELSDLEREEERARSSIVKQDQRAIEAVQDQEREAKELDDLTQRVEKQKALAHNEPSDEHSKELNDLQKQRSKSDGAHQKAVDAERSARKKVEELEWEIRKNLEEQEKKAVAIAQQETLVKALREKEQAIR